MIKPSKIWDKSAGYKTKTGAILLGLYQFVQIIAPGMLTGRADDLTRGAIDLLIITGAADWAWRERHKIKKLFTKNKK